MYGFDIRPISRLKDQSVCKTAAYILRENVRDEYQGKTHYYARGRDLLYSEIMVPEIAPESFHDLSILLTEIDRAEKRYDARTGRVVRLSLPNNKMLLMEDIIQMVREFVKEVFLSIHMCAVLAIHEGVHEDPQKNNPHAHILLTDRPVGPDGFCAKKNRTWNQVSQLNQWRQLWAEKQNQLFRDRHLDIRVSHESLEVQGIQREPTLPLGRAATALERKGIQTERGNRNREIEARAEAQRETEILHKQKMRDRRCGRER
ncbi:MobA/MobL family protein [Pseudoflavonifractor phocaeensis]|uniref:MobA/MobL family protein n=1 Tax=Pseudoflavonifractor phocaeensis TaxID=1870988 RepID=UPI0019587711|nr:MobA/MobL family protein [Pseudoflavonifractor phocaeensis]MBM6723294.1 MobA/MobL family protein [Pseudoflavonifractor phocaeensis]